MLKLKFPTLTQTERFVSRAVQIYICRKNQSPSTPSLIIIITALIMVSFLKRHVSSPVKSFARLTFRFERGLNRNAPLVVMAEQPEYREQVLQFSCVGSRYALWCALIFQVVLNKRCSRVVWTANEPAKVGFGWLTTCASRITHPLLTIFSLRKIWRTRSMRYALVSLSYCRDKAVVFLFCQLFQ